MVRDPARAPSGPPLSQGGRPDRQERHRTHGTSAGGVRPTPSTVSGGRPPTHHGESSGRGACSTGSGSSGERTVGVTTGAASGGFTPQTLIPVTTSAPTPSIIAPATVGRRSIGRGSREDPSGEGPSGPTLDVSHIFEAGSDVATLTRGQMQDLVGRIFEVKLQQFASEMGLGSTPSRSGGGASNEKEDTTRRRRSRSSHADDTQPRSRRSRRSSPDVDGDRIPQPVPLVELQLNQYGFPEGTDSLKVVGTMVREVCRLYLPDDAVWTDVPVTTRYNILDIANSLAAKYGPISVRHKNARARVESRREKNVMVTNPYGHQGFPGYRAPFEPSNAEVGAADGAAAAGGTAVGAGGDDAEFDQSSGEEEDNHGQTPLQEPVENDGEDDEDDQDSPSRFEIREAFRAPAEPAPAEPAPAAATSDGRSIIRIVVGGQTSATRTIVPQPSVQRAIPLDLQPSVARTVTPRTGTPQPSAVRTVVSDPSCARAIVPESSSRQTRAQTQPASAQDTEERRAKKSKKCKK
ncbi:hypothetical protein R1sor_018204 [Riccia sorocarpa]|uniref:Uncharacterized protein n=1 Tax=Riccia sorocarpa TaxID=122646 RepID=A0ABD3ID45_9MARC